VLNPDQQALVAQNELAQFLEQDTTNDLAWDLLNNINDRCVSGTFTSVIFFWLLLNMPAH
jgi:hypothetical protein